MVCPGIFYFVDKKLNKFCQRFFQPSILPDAEQVGIRLQDMKMRIHGFPLVRIFGGKTQVPYFSPVPGCSFYITAVYLVAGMFLDALKKGNGVFQSLCVTGGSVILT